jgi:hypothetical protein
MREAGPRPTLGELATSFFCDERAAEFERQAAAYRKLAEKRAKEYGLATPPDRR